MLKAVNIDHLVIAALDLEQGVEYVQKHLGVTIPFGGVHESMGTHNHLMRLGDSVFLEVIAPNPNGREPSQPRWYGLDDPYVRASIADEPALVGWVVNTSSIDALPGGCAVDNAINSEVNSEVNSAASNAVNSAGNSAVESRFDFGCVVPVVRGDLSWKFGLPDDGRLLAAGMLPYVIEWECAQHPAANMADVGCTLESVAIEHPQVDWLRSVLRNIGASELVSLTQAEASRLCATITTPTGRVTLRSVSCDVPST